MRVLIITGGVSSERRISLMSAKQVKEGLEEAGFQAELFDLKKGYSALKKLFTEFDVFFPVLHGEEGEGGNLQKFLAKSKKPYVGGNPKGFKKGWFKISFKRFCEKNKIITSPWKIVKSLNDFKKFGFPAVLKSSSGGSSKEVVILKSAKDLKSKLCKHLLNSGLDLFVERYLPGIEVTVGILDNQALPVIEIVPPEGKWFDYKNKYSGETREIPNAPSLSPTLKNAAQQTALKIHQTLDLGPYSRIDFIVSEKMPYVLEINTIPGLTSQSLFPKAAAAIGLTFPKLLEKIVKTAYANKIP